MMVIFNCGLLLDQIGDYKGVIKDYFMVINEYFNFLLGYQYRVQVCRKIGDVKGVDVDEFKVLKVQLDKQNGVDFNKQIVDNMENNKICKKFDKNMNNYCKIVVVDNEEGEEKYKSDYCGCVQDKNVNIVFQFMFVFIYYEKYDDVKWQVNYYKFIEILNNQKVFFGCLIIINEEVFLMEE